MSKKNKLELLKDATDNLVHYSNKLIKKSNKLLDTLVYNNTFSRIKDLAGGEVGTIRTEVEKIIFDPLVDAENIIKEMPLFLDYIISKNKKAECPFLKQVWLGDVYNAEGLQAFYTLEESLKKQLENTNHDQLLIKIKKHYNIAS